MNYAKAVHHLEAPPRTRPDLTGSSSEPWISKSAIIRLQDLLTTDMRGLEWGSGASTLWYSQRLKELHTYEHTQLWFTKLRDYIDSHFDDTNISLFHVASTITGEPQYQGAKDGYFEEYSKAPHSSGLYDAIFVDGRARSACLKTAVTKLNSGGVLVLDDARRNYDVSVVPSEWICEEHYNEVYATKIWLRPR